MQGGESKLPKVEKVLLKMKEAPSNISFDDAVKVMEWLGYTYSMPKRGSHVSFRKENCNPLSLPHKSPLKKYLVKAILDLVED